VQETKRKLFHSSVYESEAQLKRLYIQTCHRLPAFNCHLFHVREIVNVHTKKKVSVVHLICCPHLFSVGSQPPYDGANCDIALLHDPAAGDGDLARSAEFGPISAGVQ